MSARGSQVGSVGLAFLLLSSQAAFADASAAPAEPPERLDLLAGATYLQSAAAAGGAATAGLRWLALEHLAVSGDLGYGLQAGRGASEDRWWAIPSLAFVAPVGATVLDIGAGVGVGTVSGYGGWHQYFAAPFAPLWHITAAAARGHVAVAVPVSRTLALFARGEVASLLASTSNREVVWGGLWLGLRVTLL